ncbi:MAG: response regulator [Lysobacterales bacterium]
MSSAATMHVLLVEDDFGIRRLLAERLAEHRVNVSLSADLAEARAALAAQTFDAIILDLALPDGDGVEFIVELRAWSGLPVLVLSARSQEQHKIAALDAGADDYVVKPFATQELLARLRAVSRRARAPEVGSMLDCASLRIDFAGRKVWRDGQIVHLTPNEFRALTILAAHPDRVFTYRVLLAEVWGSGNSDQHHYVRIVVARLRRKLEADPSQPRHLLTETGIGYRFRC